jgi:hypothetical protein
MSQKVGENTDWSHVAADMTHILNQMINFSFRKSLRHSQPAGWTSISQGLLVLVFSYRMLSWWPLQQNYSQDRKLFKTLLFLYVTGSTCLNSSLSFNYSLTLRRTLKLLLVFLQFYSLPYIYRNEHYLRQWSNLFHSSFYVFPTNILLPTNFKVHSNPFDTNNIKNLFEC